jgi:hypothetical protein
MGMEEWTGGKKRRGKREIMGIKGGRQEGKDGERKEKMKIGNRRTKIKEIEKGLIWTEEGMRKGG